MLCGQSQTMPQLIAFRLLQGLGAGGVLPTTQTILGDIYPLAQRARLTGLFSTIWGISALLGPAIGGFLTEHVSWRWVFYVNLPLCLLAIALVSSFLHERVAHQQHRIDVLGALGLLPPGAPVFVPLLIEVLLGPGFGLSLNLTTLSVQEAVGWEQRGTVTGANQFARNIGGILGVSIAGTIFASGVSVAATMGVDPNDLLSPGGPGVVAPGELPFLRGVLADSLHAVFLLMAGAAALGGLAALFLPGARPLPVGEG